MQRPIVDHIELVDAEVPAPLDAPGTGSTGRQLAIVMAIVAALAIVWIVLERSGPAESTTPPSVVPNDEASTTTTRTVARASSVLSPQRPLSDFTGWPDPPRDHDPHVIRRPGPGEPLLGIATDLTLVYVNSLGRPTVVDLDTGRTQEVDVAKARLYDEFAVEQANVVSLTGDSRSQEFASEDAIVFQVFRAETTRGNGSGSIVVDQPIRGPRLCLTVEPCRDTQIGRTAFGDASVVVPVTAEEHPDVHSMLSGEGWRQESRWYLDPPGRDFEFRLPIPLGDQAWLISARP